MKRFLGYLFLLIPFQEEVKAECPGFELIQASPGERGYVQVCEAEQGPRYSLIKSEFDVKKISAVGFSMAVACTIRELAKIHNTKWIASIDGYGPTHAILVVYLNNQTEDPKTIFKIDEKLIEPGKQFNIVDQSMFDPVCESILKNATVKKGKR